MRFTLVNTAGSRGSLVGRGRRTTTRSGRKPRITNLRLEQLECRRLLAGVDGSDEGDLWPPETRHGVVQGTKWEDLDGDGMRGADEPGLGGVVIYSDLNRNGQLNRGEPRTRTAGDNPRTEEVDESGGYRLSGLRPGTQVIREVIPRGFVQTFPSGGGVASDPTDPEDPRDPQHGGFATVKPRSLQWKLEAGDRIVETVAIMVHPLCFAPIDMEVIASDPDVQFENLTGVRLNGCGGDVSEFEIAVTGDGQAHTFEIQFVDAHSRSVYDAIPVWINSEMPGGAHVVLVEPGGVVEGIDFGNQRLPVGSIEGHKWLDRNADGQWNDSEPGLGGIRIYLDQNRNGQWDRGERSTNTQYDDPLTADDESGAYSFPGLRPGEYVVGEVLRPGLVQTYPGVQGRVLRSVTGRFHEGVATDLDVTDVAVSLANDGSLTAELELTVVWPNGCGALKDQGTSHTVVGQHILVELAGHQVADVCDQAVTSQQQVVTIDNLSAGRYHVVATLHEDLPDTEGVATLTVVGLINLGDPGQHVVTVGENEVVPGINFGNRSTLQPGSIEGQKWLDKDGNGRMDAGEPGLPGVTIYLDLNRNGQLDDREPQTVTQGDDIATSADGVGRYAFTDLDPGTYFVREVVPDGHVQTFPPAWMSQPWPEDLTVRGDPDQFPPVPVPWPQGMHVVHVDSGQSVDDINFGNQPIQLGSIAGVKWRDDNGNGRRDVDEPGLADVMIYLDLNHNGRPNEGEPTTSTVADDPNTQVVETGLYAFVDVQPGFYRVREVVPEGYEQTYPRGFDIEPAEPLLSDGIWPDRFSWGGSHFVSLRPGHTVDGVDFGNQLAQGTGSVQGRKWIDRNGNGRRENLEPGLAGVRIYLDANLNNQFDRGEPITVTQRDNPLTDFDEEGLYLIQDVEPGFYIVREIVPAGYQQTFPEEFLCEATFCVGRGHIINIEAGESIDGLHFGNQPVEEGGSVHGRKWVDRNGNGQMDEGEPGLGGVRIYLDANLNDRFDHGEPITVTQHNNPLTDFDEAGLYSIQDVEPGFYIVREIVPAGYQQTYPEEFFCDAHFCVGRGHMVEIQAGQSIDGLHFGNQPVDDTATVQGVKWVDLNGNGQRERNEPPMAGVVIYADLNGNRSLDPREPQTQTLRDDPSTPMNETGLYRLEGIPAGETVIREVVPRRFRQTYPSPGTQILESVSVDLPGGRALALEWLSARSEIGADGQAVLALTFQVVWRDGCGTLLPERAEVSLENDRIDVQLFGTHVGEACTLALKPESQTVRLAVAGPGSYEVRTFLYESARPGAEFERSFGLEGRLVVGGEGGHRVRLQPGETREGLHFGNQRLAGPDPALLEAADFDHDGQLGATDINRLAAAIRSDDAPADVYDLSGDGRVSRHDLNVMVQQALQTSFGDSNLDGRFDSSDFVKVFQAGKYEAGPEHRAGWEEGDWNGDGLFNSSDMVFVFQQGQYEVNSALSAEPPAAGAVDILLALRG